MNWGHHRAVLAENKRLHKEIEHLRAAMERAADELARHHAVERTQKSVLDAERGAISACTTCGAPLVEGGLMTDIKRIWAPYHACVSWTYMLGERAEEALLRIRRELKTAAGWWTGADELDWQELIPPPSSVPAATPEG